MRKRLHPSFTPNRYTGTYNANNSGQLSGAHYTNGRVRMVSLLLLLGGAVGLTLARKKAKRSSDTAVQAALAQPPSAPGQLTPARVAVHGDLMRYCADPKKLNKAAALFNHEGLTQHAQTLLRKAAMVHEMMHGAKSIVERCRAGDQHAMAMAKSIGEQARGGNKRAQLSWFLIENYTKEHPAEEAA